jgi:hypothetical protein
MVVVVEGRRGAGGGDEGEGGVGTDGEEEIGRHGHAGHEVLVYERLLLQLRPLRRREDRRAARRLLVRVPSHPHGRRRAQHRCRPLLLLPPSFVSKQRTVWTADVLPAEEGGRGQVGVEGFLVAAINGGEEGVGGKGSWWWGVRGI